MSASVSASTGAPPRHRGWQGRGRHSPEEGDDGVRDSPWDNFMDWMDEHHELVSTICTVLGVIAMAACVVALVVPGLNVAAAAVLAGVAMGASSPSHLGHSALAVSGNGSWVDVGIDVFSLATFGAGRFLGPGVKILGKEFGGVLGRLTAETKTAGAMARGNAARVPVQAQVNADIAEVRLRLVGGASRRVERSVYSQVKAIRVQGQAASQKAFDAAADCYGAQKKTTTFEERLGLGGGDPDLAMLRVEAQDAVRGSSSTSKVGLAYAKADAQYLKAFAPTAASNLVGVSSLGTDFIHVKRYDAWRDRWPTKVKGTL
jgi:hypothetical protein